MQAQPDLHGCTGVAWDVTGIGAGSFFLTAGVVGTGGACFMWVSSVAGAVDVGCMCGAGEGNAVYPTEKQCLVRACSVAVVPLGTVFTALMLHS